MPRPRIPQRREHLLVAARELALEQGWPATTVSDIAERAGIGKGAVYLEFSTKAAILDALVNCGMRSLGAEVRRRVLEAEETVGLSAIYRFGVEALLADPLMRAFYLGDEGALGDHVRAVDDDRYRQRFDWLGDYLRQLQDAGLIASDVELPAAVRMLSVFTIGLLHAPGTLGAITDAELHSTVGLFSALVDRGLAPRRPAAPDTTPAPDADTIQNADTTPDAGAARRAQLALIERLETQLDQLQTDPAEESR
ncbi:TetR/AcrR family transcriptional regulator [Ruania zhangjianzhongii]|uniref:TetR/AcrR family transcriptional regulator n=1 Tax=Ruania zhangjianzhongii TaxID=2603206 RepID=UPI0011C904EC|nr:TetR/AcrR family transcriptional regulator [Ruania zhangjianzhongii]